MKPVADMSHAHLLAAAQAHHRGMPWPTDRAQATQEASDRAPELALRVTSSINASHALAFRRDFVFDPGYL